LDCCRFPAERLYAIHNWARFAPGKDRHHAVGMAAADRIEITIDGRGGHGAASERRDRSGMVAGHIITAAQSFRERNVKSDRTAVVSLLLDAGRQSRRDELIPAHAKLVATVRTFRS
jgi:hippurate hydrolase